MASEPSSPPPSYTPRTAPPSPPSAVPASKFTTEALHKDVDDVFKAVFRFMQVTNPQKQVLDLNGQVPMLHDASRDLRAASSGQSSFLGLSTASQLHWSRLWLSVNVVGDHCRVDTLRPLHNRLRQVISSNAEPFKAKTELRLPIDELEWYEDIFRALECFTETLEVLSAAIRLARHSNTVNIEGSFSPAAREDISILLSSTSNLRQKLYDNSGQYNGGRIPAIQEMRQALDAADSLARTLPAVSKNRHFLAPNPANDHYTGRRQQLQAIENTFSVAYSSTQKRLIIEGGPGSGKTELALKYAQDHKSAYWGVFWVDASTRSNAKQSYAEIAITLGVDANERSAKNWLSGRSYPWLLIIDNVDDEEMKLSDLVPPGSIGCVLVTTRNPALGNAGDKCLKLGEMDDNEATELLLRAATQPEPWGPSVTDLAVSICKHLYYLPLALVHAGNAIKNNICNLRTFIKFFDSSATRIRRERSRSRSRSRNRNTSIADDGSMPIYGSSEILFGYLEKRAENDQTYRTH